MKSIQNEFVLIKGPTGLGHIHFSPYSCYQSRESVKGMYCSGRTWINYGVIVIDETGGIVLDVGSSSIKLGYGGEDGPRLVYPSVIQCCCPFYGLGIWIYWSGTSDVLSRNSGFEHPKRSNGCVSILFEWKE